MKENHLAEPMPEVYGFALPEVYGFALPEVYGFALPVVEMAAMPPDWVSAVSRDLRAERPYHVRREAHDPSGRTMASAAARGIGVGELSRVLRGDDMLP